LYWPGDSKVEGIRKRFLSLRTDYTEQGIPKHGPKAVWREEILCGYQSGIPVCCIVWYILAIYLCLLTRRDMAVLPLMFGEDGWERFFENDYYQCPLCRHQNWVVPILWWSGSD